MIILPPNLSKRLVGRWQSTLDANASLSCRAISGIRLDAVIFISPSNPSNPMKVVTP
jgi:hypothetical protein